ncbi:MAG TPA: uroporphyrinogen decarboxylase [Acidimicrobiia bacterium]|mgnify:CR=1 FL=1|nr:uroporphyrinogen decarboxylase [Acidimicrobiia bacterium]
MRLLAALRGEPLDRPPVWFMRQAGRYLPEYRELRERHSFLEAMRSPDIATEITLQPLRRFPLDAAIVFADIMTPLEAMGIDVDFAPGPRLDPLTVEEVCNLPRFEPTGVEHVVSTIGRVRAAAESDIAVVGFAGGPATILAYLLEGSGSRQFPNFRRALLGPGVDAALDRLAQATRRYLQMQVEAGADVVQLFDSWAGLVSIDVFRRHVVPAARETLVDLDVPTIYFAPAGSHLLEAMPEIGATAYGVDWRLPIDEAWRRLGSEHPVQGNLDPAVLLTDPDTVVASTTEVLERGTAVGGHVFNLGHGILPTTPVDNVAAMVEAVVAWDRATAAAKGAPT